MQPPRDRQWDAIRQTERHLLVAAGAGTGKTTTVVGRIVYLLGAEVRGQRIETPRRIGDIAAITYTNAAAADLKRKLRAELRASDLRASDLRAAAYEVDNARIGTIHGFCGDILREFALRAGRNPRARVLEEGEAGALVAEAVRDALLAALEEGSIPELEDVLATWPVETVEGWACRLVSDSDRLGRILAADAPHNAQERAVLALAQRSARRLGTRLAERSALDFDRMIVWTRDLLRDQPHVRRALQRRLHTLVVDEFQDVDPVQREIAYLLGEPESGRTDTPRLMLVGDPKQSIYRFRRADVTVWTGVERDFETYGQGGVVRLDENFRSVEPILAFADATIGPILDEPIAGEAHDAYEVKYASVRATRTERALDPVVELLVTAVGPDEEIPKVDEIRAREAEAVARRARALHDAGTDWRDMAVLLTSWSDVELYEAALRRAGAKTYALRGEGFAERREVLDLVLALEAIRDPRDDRALLGWLRSPFVGLKDETLLAIARGARQPYWDELASVRTGESELLAWGIELLEAHVRLRDRIPTHELLESLLECSGYFAYLSLLGDEGLQAIANVRKLVRLARQLPDGSVGDFLRTLREARARGDREGDARLYGERDDVVTITSVHSAKGLEWPVVFWCDLVRRGASDSGASMLVGRDRIALKDPEQDAKGQSHQWQGLLAAEDRECQAERKRLWYVALTRAKDRLILSGLCAEKMDAKCPGSAIWRRLGPVPAEDGATFGYEGQGGRRFEAVVRLVPVVTGDGRADERRGVVPELPAPLPVLAVAGGRPRHSATELMAYERCGRRHWFRYVAGLREPAVDRTGADYMSAVARGQIVHDVLERLEDDEAIDPLLEVAIGRWDPDAPTPEQPSGIRYREHLRDEIRAVTDHPDYRAIAGLPSARRELAFLHLAAPGGFVEGKMDLVARTADGLVVLDVKTTQGDADKAKEVAAHYALQRDTYLGAVEAIAAAPVVRFAFQFSRAGVQVSEATTDAVRTGARARIDRLLGGIGRDAAPLTSNAADCRFCGYQRVGWCDGVPEAS